MPRLLNATRALFLTACFALALGAPSALAAPQLLVPSGSGLTDPGGVAVTPDGGIWIADGEKGICRVDTEAPGLVEADWCSGTSPISKAGQMAFDPATNFLYVAEASSDAAGVWRLLWDPITGTIVSGRRIVNTGDDLVAGLAASYTGPPAAPGGPPTAEINFMSKDSTAVRRVRAPTSVLPNVITVGIRSSDEELEAGGSLAALGADLYLTDSSGVTVLNTQPGTTPVARPVPGLSAAFPSGAASAVATDETRGRVYAGTSNGNARDQIDVLHRPSGRQETYAVGVAGVLAMAAVANGDLIVLDDPLNGVNADVNDQARVWRVELAAIGLPRVAITAAPPGYGSSSTARFDYSGPAGATFECSIDDEPFQDCGGPDAGSTELSDLDERTHSFAVRAIDSVFGAGPVERRVYVVDSHVPELSIDNPAGDRYPAGTSFTLRFSANEPNLDFTCSISDGPSEPCSPSTHLFTGLTPGWHTARVSAVDAAGNWSLESENGSFDFYVRPPAAPGPDNTVPTPSAASVASAGPAPTPAPAAVARGDARLRLGRGYSCVIGGQTAWVSGSSIAGVTFRLDGRRIAVLTLSDASGRFAVRLRRLATGSHRLTATVRFARGAGRPERLRRDFRRCGAGKDGHR